MCINVGNWVKITGDDELYPGYYAQVLAIEPDGRILVRITADQDGKPTDNLEARTWFDPDELSDLDERDDFLRQVMGDDVIARARFDEDENEKKED